MRRELAPWLTGRELLEVELLAPLGPKYVGLPRALGRRVESVGRRGKFLLMPLSGGLELVAHLGMTGVIAMSEPSERQAGYVRVRVRLSGDAPNVLYFLDPRRFGRFLVVEQGQYETLPTLAALGPEPLEPEFTAAGFGAALARSRMAVKAYLLSQRPVAGVGNIYADEALWRARVHPLTPAAALKPEQVARLHHAVREVLSAALAAQGTTLSDYRTVRGRPGEYAKELDVYGRGGEACPACGATLERLVVAQRGTTYCPACQALPRGGSRRNRSSGGGSSGGGSSGGGSSGGGSSGGGSSGTGKARNRSPREGSSRSRSRNHTSADGGRG
ncbi:MAG: bifunctional DNA-formamidopyrimidine glycosylase/DNA-(apurinic or apyrimidinic site) lyase [Truepera sp.]|nr:bifunctional DNA-formamidopyrimidine glycosylase/DNA-(apurinic or apyrimidinic site) lyase [Truepera sp.]